ncbi:MAG: hypothetical protein JWM90_276, partial [Thermoleophilia bacterium]|nr:hypothetical protein [Thermoleophilia bacterium]
MLMDVPRSLHACLRFGTHVLLPILLVLIALLAASPASGATPKLVVRGTAVEGSALTVKAPKGAKLSWLRCTATGAKCRAIKGAKRAGYVLTTADVGSTVRAATGVGTRQLRSKQSIRVRPKAPIATTWPTVSGSGVVGSALTATTGTWAPAGRTYAYQYKWLRCSSTACTAIPGAVGSSYVPTNADSGFAIRVEVTALTSLRTLRGVSNSGVARSAVGVTPFDASVVNTKAPAILGTAKEGAQLQATLGEWSALGLPVTTRVAWTRCLATCTSIAGADALTYVATAADVGSRLRVDVTGTTGPSSATVSSSMSATVAVAAPTNVTAPTLSATGTPGIGDSISVTNGTWNAFAPTSFSHQWQRCTPPGTSSCTDIPGATSTPYVTVAADADSTLRARVTITHLTASAISTSGVTLTVTGAGPTSTAAPIISGQVIDGATLTTSGGTFAGPGFITTAGQWRRCDGAGASCADIAGATASTYVLGGADVGSTIIHAITGTNAWGSATRASAATAVVATADPANVTLPSIAGTLYDTGSATATTGTWSGLTPMAFTHQWRRCDAGGGSCTNIAGATSATHAVTGADVGSTLRVVVTATNAAHPATDISATSAASGQVGASPAPALVTVPTVTGIVEDGATLTWHAGTYTGQLPISFTRQWQRCDASGSSCVNIAGATAATYATTAADVGNTLRVQEQATNSFGSTPLAASSVTSAVAPVVPANGSLPTVTGTKVDGATLTATSGTWTGTPTITHAYQWRRCNSSGAACVDVGTNATTYLLTAADVASTIRVAVTATNAAGPSLAATSAATTLVAAAPPVASTPLPAVTGTSARNEVLSTTSGTFTGTAPFTHTYQWQRCNAAGGACVSIAGATASSYTLVLADVTKTIRAQVTAHSTLIVASAVATSAASAVIADVVIPPSETTAVVIGGLAEQHTTLTLTPAVFAGTGPITHAYQWQRCDSVGTSCVNVTNVGDPSGLTWTLDAADVGSTLRVIDTGTNSAGSAPSTSAPTDVVIETVPAANTEAPAITGQLEEGVTISTTGGVWAGTPVPNVAVAWYRCNVDGSACAAISGANDMSYTLVAADVTFAVQVRAVGSNTYGTDTASSAISSEVAPARIPVNSGTLPSVSSQSTIPETTQDLNVADGTWTGTEATKTYQWKRCDQYGEVCAPIAGQTETTYHLVHPTDAGSTFRAEVTYTNVAGTDMAESPATPVVVAATPPATSDPLVIEQDANATINIVTAPVWTGTETITYEYEWMLCYSATETDPSQCDSHAGPDGNSSYTTTSADFQDVPAWLMLRIWATNLIEPDGVSSELSNGISLPVWCEACPGTCLCSNISPPVITGDAIFPGTLSGSDGEWTGSLALTYLYQWQRCDGSGANCVDLPGATSSTYETAFLDVGNTLVFQVIA